MKIYNEKQFHTLHLSVAYFCPVLEEEGEILYRVERPGGFEIRICEELAESLLERGAVGMELTRA